MFNKKSGELEQLGVVVQMFVGHITVWDMVSVATCHSDSASCHSEPGEILRNHLIYRKYCAIHHFMTSKYKEVSCYTVTL